VSRIAAKFAELKKQGRGALIPFVEAWDPDRETSTQLLLGMPGAGADLIEIGMPFTDPMADGLIIQAAAKRALVSGVKVRFILEMVRTFRAQDQTTPIVLMGYLNPILSYGPEKFCVDAAKAGVDGMIIVDLPPEESDLILPFTNANGLDFIRLVAPTTDDARLPHVLNGSSGFVYYVSITGITVRAAPPRRNCRKPFRASAGSRTCRSRSASACGRPRRRPRRLGLPTRRWWPRR